VLTTLGFQDGAADIESARLWYERAARLGSAEARDRLQQLATASAR
jgi:TPR repeat protein